MTTPGTTVAGRLPASIPHRLLQGVVDLFVVAVAATASFRLVPDTGPAGFWQHVFRGLVLPVDLVFLGLVGIVSMLLGRRTRRLGDRLTGTVVEPAD